MVLSRVMAKNQDAHLINMLMNLTKPVKHSNRKLVISLKIYRNTFFQMHSQNVNGFGLTELMKILMQIEYNRSGYGSSRNLLKLHKLFKIIYNIY